MANLYPYFGNGTFETCTGAYCTPPTPPIIPIGRTNEDAHTGQYSFANKTFPGKGIAPGVNYQYHFVLRGRPGHMHPIILQEGNRYKVSAWIKTPEGAGQFGTDGVRIFLYRAYGLLGGGVLESQDADGEVWAMDNGDRMRIATVGNIKGRWVQVWFEFTEADTGYGGLSTPAGQRVSFAWWICKSSGNGPFSSPGGNDEEIFENGVVYLDDIVLEGEQTCDLAFQSPSYTKTDETAENANDGTATIHATTSAGPIEYSIDGGVTFQLSNVFTGLAPGLYKATVRDTAGCVKESVNIPILAFTPEPPPPPPPPPPSGTLAVNSAPVNANNFIAWFAASGKADFANLNFTNCNWDLPNAYRVNKIHEPHRPVIVNDEQFSFYINFDRDYNYPNFSSLRLDLVTKYGIVESGVGVLQRVFQQDGIKYFIYANVTLTNKAPGAYRLMIVDTSTPEPGDVLFISQELELMSASDAGLHTARFRFRSSLSMYRYLYQQIPDFLQQVRLRVNVVDEEAEGELQQYRAVTSGRLRNVSFDLDRFITLETYFFDDLAHRAMQVLQAHDYILLNDRAYLVKSLYKISRDPAASTNKGTLELYEQAFSTSNRYGGDPNAEALRDPALLGDNDQAILL